jgi:hypothetical protein
MLSSVVHDKCKADSRNGVHRKHNVSQEKKDYSAARVERLFVDTGANQNIQPSGSAIHTHTDNRNVERES